jgi:hypothetical protein
MTSLTDRLAHETSPKGCSDLLLSWIKLLPVAAKPAKRPARATKSGIRRKVAGSAWIENGKYLRRVRQLHTDS